MASDGTREVLAVRYGSRVTTRAETFLNYHLYGEPDGKIDVDYYFWVIRDGDGTAILVDTGFAPAVGDRRRRTWHTTTPADALPGLGVDPAAVRTVVVTHAHWDHIGNLGQFPRAEIVMSRAEYEFWTGPIARRAQFAAHAEPDELARLEAARAEGRLTLISGRHTAAPGVGLVEVGGHTPGELIVTVAAGAATVVLASDAPALLRGGRTRPPVRHPRRPPGDVPDLRPARPASDGAANLAGGRPRPRGPRPLRPLPRRPERRGPHRPRGRARDRYGVTVTSVPYGSIGYACSAAL